VAGGTSLRAPLRPTGCCYSRLSSRRSWSSSSGCLRAPHLAHSTGCSSLPREGIDDCGRPSGNLSLGPSHRSWAGPSSCAGNDRAQPCLALAPVGDTSGPFVRSPCSRSGAPHRSRHGGRCTMDLSRGAPRRGRHRPRLFVHDRLVVARRGCLCAELPRKGQGTVFRLLSACNEWQPGAHPGAGHGQFLRILCADEFLILCPGHSLWGPRSPTSGASLYVFGDGGRNAVVRGHDHACKHHGNAPSIRCRFHATE
jgi:hypothetical protein